VRYGLVILMREPSERSVRRRQSRAGHSVVEYAIILAFVVMVAVFVLRNIGSTTNNSMTPVGNALQQ
jgi:Flp pilus assembly pilin Flp